MGDGDEKVRGPRSQFRPKEAAVPLLLSTFAKRQLKVLAKRLRLSASDAVELLLRQYGGALAAVTADVVVRPTDPPGTSVTLTKLGLQILDAACARTDASRADVVEQLLESHRESVVLEMLPAQAGA